MESEQVNEKDSMHEKMILAAVFSLCLTSVGLGFPLTPVGILELMAHRVAKYSAGGVWLGITWTSFSHFRGAMGTPKTHWPRGGCMVVAGGAMVLF